jgi:hypothetical protein
MDLDMKLKSEIDRKLQKSMRESGFEFLLDECGGIEVALQVIDEEAKAVMLYLIPKEEIPEGELSFFISPVEHTYGVFHINSRAVMIEINSSALQLNN